MNRINEYKFIRVGPGDMIQSEMEAYGWSQEDLAKKMAMPSEHIYQLIDNSRTITDYIAYQLGMIFGPSKEFWLNQQKIYDDNFFKSADP